MIPEGMKSMFGIKDEKDMKMANNIWKMLDEMSSNDPEAYKKFISKNLNEGVSDAKAKKQQKEKPWKIVPSQYCLLQMDAKLEEKIVTEDTSTLSREMKEKLDMNINKEKWGDVRGKFPNKIRIHLNLCHCDRVKNPTSKSKQGKQITNFQLPMLQDVESLYYSLQGPLVVKEDHYYAMIFSTNFLRGFDSANAGRKLLMSLAITYFQERIASDRNMILSKVDTVTLYNKNLYYAIDKMTIQVSDHKFRYGDSVKNCEFLLEPQVDNSKERAQKLEKGQKIEQKEEKKNMIKQKTDKPKEFIIKTKPDSPKAKQEEELPPLLPQKTETKNKKMLIEVIDEKQMNEGEKESDVIPYQMKESDSGYSFEFLVHGVSKISEIDLEVSSETIKLGAGTRRVEVQLKKKVNEDSVKAKMKKKTNTLSVELKYK